MNVEVKLYGFFKRYAPDEQREFNLDLPAETTVEELLVLLKIPLDLDRVLLVNGRRSEPQVVMAPGDTIVIFSPLTGG